SLLEFYRTVSRFSPRRADEILCNLGGKGLRAMSVIVDDRPLEAERLGLKTVGQVLSHLKKGNRLVVHVLIDGKEPDLKRIRAIKKFPLNAHNVFIETADPKQMARQFLDEVEAQLTEADRLKGESTKLLDRNQYAPAMEK